MTFADIVKSGKANKTFTPDELKAIKLKTPDQYTMIGQSVPQLDIPSKTNGTANTASTRSLPGMVYGKLVIPPVRYGATVKSVDDSAAKKVPGFIKAVILDDKTATTTGWVVAVATTTKAPRTRPPRSRVDYDKGPNAKLSDQSLIDEVKPPAERGQLRAPLRQGRRYGGGLRKAAKVMEAEYPTNLNIHAPMEPMNARALSRAAFGTSTPATSSRRAPPRSRRVLAGVGSQNVVMHQIFWAAASGGGWTPT